jgi:hypothetical protein
MPTLEQYLAEHPEAAPKRGGIKPEHVLQIACKQWLTEALPATVMWTAVEKGVYYGGNAKRRMAMAARAKARGIKNGVPDFHFWWQGTYLAVELKVGGNATQDDQDNWIAGLRLQAFHAEVARSVSELERHLRAYGFPVRTSAKGIDERLPLREPPKRARASKPRAPRPTARGLRVAARFHTR